MKDINDKTPEEITREISGDGVSSFHKFCRAGIADYLKNESKFASLKRRHAYKRLTKVWKKQQPVKRQNKYLKPKALKKRRL